MGNPTIIQKEHTWAYHDAAWQKATCQNLLFFRMVVARGWQGKEMGNCFLNGNKVSVLQDEQSCGDE